MISLVDRNYVYRIVNDAYLNNYRKSREELIGKTIREVVGEELFERVSKPNLARAFAGETVSVESWMVVPEMGRRYLSVTYHPVCENSAPPEFVAIDVRDITALKLAEADCQRVFELSLDMLCIAGFDGYYEQLNPAWSRTLGWSEDELKSSQLIDFVIPSDREATLAAMQRLFKGEQLVGFENRLQCMDGTVKWISWNSFPDLEKQQIFAVARDVSGRRALEDELRRLATTDSLTGANNRRHFLEQASAELKRSRRYGAPLAVLMLDIDHFKQVNDSFGHDAGDEVLKKLVDSCLQTLRSSDLFGRFGGEEFVALLPETSEQAALQTCERLSQELAGTRIRTHRGTIQITASIGLTMLTGSDQDLDSLLKRADNALYEAKNAGRNLIVRL
jgi:diguanylate cyclase (GGDEF)-like protein/PAS domain S-box-containing protein